MSDSALTFSTFHNALRIMLNIDRDELVKAGVVPDIVAHPEKHFVADEAWRQFNDSPYRFFIRIPTGQAQALWKLIESRQPQKQEISTL
jgi:hypothetical protein